MSKKQLYNIILVVLGVLLILPLFLPIYNYVAQGNGITYTETVGLFSGKISNADGYKVQDYFEKVINREAGNFFYVLSKIAAFVAIIAGICLAVVAVLSLLNKDLSKYQNIISMVALVAMAAGALVFLFGFITFIISTKEIGVKNTKIFMSGAIGWYLVFIGSIGSGVIVKFLIKD